MPRVSAPLTKIDNTRFVECLVTLIPKEILYSVGELLMTSIPTAYI